MKHIPTVSVVALALLGGVGAANAAATSTTKGANTPAYAAPVIANADAMKAADAVHHTNLRQQLNDQLTKAGYTSIKIMPSSFYVQAKDKSGNPVAMVVGPDSFAEVTEVNNKTPGPTAQQQTPASQMTPNASAKEK